MKEEEREMLIGWWSTYDTTHALINELPSDSTFVMEYEGKPLYAWTIYLTNTKSFCFMKNIIRNPNMKPANRHKAMQQIAEHSENFARSLGYKRIIGSSAVEYNTELYKSFGYKIASTPVVFIEKEL